MPARPIYDIRRLPEHNRTFNEAAVRALCHTSYAGAGDTIGFVLGRYKMLLDARDIGLSSHLMLDGFRELEVAEALVRCIRRGSTAIHVGAGLGYHTLLLADLVGPEGRVIAFEPNPLLVRCATESIRLNGFGAVATLHDHAIGSAEGKGTLVWERPRPTAGRMEEPRDGADPVAVRRLDASPGALDAEFIMIDVEGREQQVWRGMTGILANGQPLTVFLRFHAGHYLDPVGFLAEIAGEGFTLELIDPDRGLVPATVDAAMGGYGAARLLCFRR